MFCHKYGIILSFYNFFVAQSYVLVLPLTFIDCFRLREIVVHCGAWYLMRYIVFDCARLSLMVFIVLDLARLCKILFD